MSKLDGGIFSRPRGKTANIVFGAARTRNGKVVTAREFVPPSNPKTDAQQDQRGIFSECLAIVRAIGSTVYKSDWNRAIGQLAGFQSLMSIYMNAMDSNFELSPPPDVNLGSLFIPDDMSADTGSSGADIDFSWSTDTPGQATDNDVLVVIGVEVPSRATPESRDIVVDTSNVRSDGSAVVEMNTTAKDYVFFAYFRGVDSASGLLSVAASLEASTPV